MLRYRLFHERRIDLTSWPFDVGLDATDFWKSLNPKSVIVFRFEALAMGAKDALGSFLELSFAA